MRKRFLSLALALVIALAFTPAVIADGENGPGTYNIGDIMAINAIIADHSLNWTPAPEDGSYIPSDWFPGVGWDWGVRPELRVSALHVSNMNLTGILDVSGLTALERLDCWDNQLTALNVSGLTVLKEINSQNNQLASLDVSGLTSLKQLVLDNNNLTVLDVSGNASLIYLWCSYNQLAELNVAGLTSLEVLNIRFNQLTALDVSGLTSLIYLDCGSNKLTSIDVSGLRALTTLYAHINRLTGIALSPDAQYEWIGAHTNYMPSKSAVTGQAIMWNDTNFLFDPQYAAPVDPTPDEEEEVFLTNSQLNEIKQGDPLELTFAEGTMVFSPEAASGLVRDATGGGINVSLRAVELDIEELSEKQAAIVEDRPVFDLTVTVIDANNRPITQFGGPVTITVPYTLRPGETNQNAIVVYYLAPDGSLRVERGRYLERDGSGWVSFTVTHFSQFVIAYNEVTFGDVDENHPNKDAIDFLAAREIITGTGGGFAPDRALTRAGLLVIIMKAFGIEEETGLEEYKFTDARGQWFENWTATARKRGIIDGTGNNIFTEREITREEVLLLVYRTLEAIGETLPAAEDGKMLNDFADAGKLSGWAVDNGDKIEAVLMAGIYTCDDILPQETYARALMAQLLYNLLTK
jgi:hypothetical protein